MLRATAILAVALGICASTGAAFTQRTLHGTVVDERTKQPVAFVSVILDSSVTVLTSSEGFFDFGDVAAGDHVLIFDHIAYVRRVVRFVWPGADIPLRVVLEPSQFTMEKIVVTEKRVRPSVGAVKIDRVETIVTPGNIANDPLRTVQSQPACASDGVDFLSKTAVRGGDTEEHRVYFDGYHLRHFAHAGGYTGIVYDDLIQSAELLPGAAPLAYTGNLSGVVALSPVNPDTSLLTFRYDITSMAGGISQELSPSVAVQASAKTSYFDLPAYQEVGVDNRSFRDVIGRVKVSPRPTFDVTTTVLAAWDTEDGTYPARAGSSRKVTSFLSGVDGTYRNAGWELGLRPSFSRYDSRDGILFPGEDRSHDVRESEARVKVARRGRIVGVGVTGTFGSLRHEGTGGTIDDTPYSASAQFTLTRGRVAEVTLGGGGSREPWTSDVEPEAYGSVGISVGSRLSLGVGYRRSHQSPFLFSERRLFASVPIDAGDLLAAYAPTWKDAPAVRMDQASVEATVGLLYDFEINYSGFGREYRDLLTWDWDDFPDVTNVGSDGEGHGFGHEVTLTRNDPDFISLMVAVSRARVWKREGTLEDERVGDFDRPASWQAGVSWKATRHIRFSLRWIDMDGRPFTPYGGRAEPAPTTRDVNSSRLPRFQRLDLKFVYTILDRDFDGEIFVDVLNLFNHENTAMKYVLEVQPGEFISLPFEGAKLFPIGGATVRW